MGREGGGGRRREGPLSSWVSSSLIFSPLHRSHMMLIPPLHLATLRSHSHDGWCGAYTHFQLCLYAVSSTFLLNVISTSISLSDVWNMLQSRGRLLTSTQEVMSSLMLFCLCIYLNRITQKLLKSITPKLVESLGSLSQGNSHQIYVWIS